MVILNWVFLLQRLSLKYGNSLREDLRCSNHSALDTDNQKCGFYAGNCIRFLDLNGPFILGGIPEDNQRTDLANRLVKRIQELIESKLVELNSSN